MFHCRLLSSGTELALSNIRIARGRHRSQRDRPRQFANSNCVEDLMKHARRIFPVMLITLVAVTLASPAEAQRETIFGARIGYYTDLEEPFVGGEFLTGVGNSIFFNPNLEYVFVDRADFLTFNFDFHYDFPVDGNYYLWAGAGPAILYSNPEGPRASDTDFGANFFLGIGFGRGRDVVPYIQGKVIASDNSDFSIAFGVRF